MSIGDIVLAFEGTYAEYLRISVPGWVDDYPAAKFAYVIYGTPESRLASAISTSQRKHVGYIYVTGNTGANPYRFARQLLGARERDHRGLRIGRADITYRHGLRCPARADANKIPSMPPRDVGRAEPAEVSRRVAPPVIGVLRVQH